MKNNFKSLKCIKTNENYEYSKQHPPASHWTREDSPLLHWINQKLKPVRISEKSLDKK